jgi:TetR/AcrR family transcriptional repressor of nem operon
MRTARLHSETKEKLCDAARRLMLEQGFPATSVEQICTAAGVTKGSFFHYFDSKEHIGKELLERFLAERLEENQILRQEPDPLRRVYAVVDAAIGRARSAQRPRGSIPGTFAQELSRTYPDIKKMCDSTFGALMRDLQKDLTDAKKLYAPDAAFEPHSLADCFVALIEGSHILEKLRPDAPILETNLRHFRAYLDHLYQDKFQPARLL